MEEAKKQRTIAFRTDALEAWAASNPSIGTDSTDADRLLAGMTRLVLSSDTESELTTRLDAAGQAHASPKARADLIAEPDFQFPDHR